MRTAKKLLAGLQVLSGGAIISAILVIIVSIVGFNSEGYFVDDKLGIQFRMILDATEQEITVWIQLPKTLFIKCIVTNVYKINDEGVQQNAQLGDLFPIGVPSYGGGVITVEIYEMDDDVMPDLSARDQSIVPFAHIRKESQFSTALRYMMLGGSFALNNWTVFKYGILGGALGCVLLGVGLRFKNKRPSAVVQLILSVE